MSEASLYLLVAMSYGAIGLVLDAVYYFAPRLREERVVHLLTALVIALSACVAVLGAPLQFARFGAFHRGAEFFLFLGASLLHVPVVIYLLLHYWELLLEKITSPGSTREPPRKPRTEREHWDLVERHLQALANDPTDAASHERLGDLYSSMGFFDSAAYQYTKAAAWMDRGYAQASVLHKAARVYVEKKKDTPGGLVLLRRIVRLYPRSYFAAYSRRVINQHEAHSQLESEPDSEQYKFFPPELEE